MPITPEQAMDLVKFINLHEEDDVEKAKEKFEELYVESKELSRQVGKITGTVLNVAKKGYESLGIAIADEELKDKKVEDILRLGFERVRGEQDKQKEEWEKKATPEGTNELVKEWEKKLKSLERKLSDTESSRQDVITQFESYKTDVKETTKRSKIESIFEKELQGVRLDPSVNALTIKGFKSELSDKYVFDLEEDGTPIVKDKSSLQPLKSKEKANVYMTIAEVIAAEAAKQDLLQKNPGAGRKYTQTTPAGVNVPLDSVDDRKRKGINPAFFGNFK
jgi:hypothetical protein